MGGVITGPAFTQQFPSINTTTGQGNSTLQGFVVAVYNIGCWAGSLLTMVVGERLGRKRTIMIGATILAIGTVIQCSSFTIAQLIVCNKTASFKKTMTHYSGRPPGHRYREWHHYIHDTRMAFRAGPGQNERRPDYD